MLFKRLKSHHCIIVFYSYNKDSSQPLSPNQYDIMVMTVIIMIILFYYRFELDSPDSPDLPNVVLSKPTTEMVPGFEDDYILLSPSPSPPLPENSKYTISIS